MLTDSIEPARTELLVHILHRGHALCPQEGIPRDWPDHHRWVPIGCVAESNCQACIAIAKTPEIASHAG